MRSAVRRLSLSMDVTEGHFKAIERTAKDMGLSTDHLVLLALSTGIEALTGVDLMKVDPLELMADDLSES